MFPCRNWMEMNSMNRLIRIFLAAFLCAMPLLLNAQAKPKRDLSKDRIGAVAKPSVRNRPNGTAAIRRQSPSKPASSSSRRVARRNESATRRSRDSAIDYDNYSMALEQQADQGDVRAISAVGLAYLTGDGAPLNANRAFYYFRKGAQLGDAWSAFLLGVCYESGQGVSPDMNMAIRLYVKAANRGIGAAMSRLGLYISSFTNSGNTENDWLAFELFRAAAHSGESWGMFYLGRCLCEGVGHEADWVKGVYWIEKAAEVHEPLATDYISQHGIVRNILSPSEGEEILSEQTGNEQRAVDLMSMWEKDG